MTSIDSAMILNCTVPGCEQPNDTHTWDTLNATGEPVRFHDVRHWPLGESASVHLGATEIPGKPVTYDVQVEVPDWNNGLTGEQTRTLAAQLVEAADRLDEITAAQR